MKKSWGLRRVFGLIFGIILVGMGFAIFTARIAIYPWWYHRNDVGVRLPECSNYQSKVYIYCHDPKSALTLDFKEFSTEPEPLPEHATPVQTRGWYVPAASGVDTKGSVILVHGGGVDRRAMTKHVSYLNAAGYHTLLIDCLNHGLSSSDGRGLSYGLWESQSIAAAAKWVRKNITGALSLPIIAMGTSQGAFAALKAMSESELINGVVAENPYISAKRLLLEFPAIEWEPRFVKEIALRLVALWLGHSLDELDVHAFVGRIGMRPVFLIHGLDDEIVNARQSEEIYQLLAGPKEIWLVRGGRHESLWNIQRQDYERRVLEFLKNIRQPAGS